ncbi:hypothetical protein AMATHDRAFT_7737 [Amanita thiersii Skay4041]|uniref:Ubiquitin carboxyl-terminal hydrolase n=1 Tax=Amanita thiersii Skay4041 TaxID=703135 RepID=A0A2A9NE22_9AGAR|nr:hypothetical protein AMATHDRAFT_7737 [Amanita thiersii Skay4041]
MAPINVHIKHVGKNHDIHLDPDLPPLAFKEAIYQVTGVPVDRMKVMIKGGVLKDDTPWKKISPKEGQTFMVIGAAGELPKPPEKPILFLEDMDDSELAEALAKPVGLSNLGNTCYMNATIQALRAVPELQIALNAPSLPVGSPLPNSLRDLYKNMSRTTESVNPTKFLEVLRQINPQFAERDRGGKGTGGYSQQDAEECYSQIINSLRPIPGIPSTKPVASTKSFVEQYLMGEMRRTMTCDEAPDEPPSVMTEKVLKIECNITGTTNFMLAGLKNALDTTLEKNSPSLGREATYSQKSRLTRLPTYLTVHMVRFAWRADIGKKAKIMRKVKFPTEFDALDIVTDELKSKLLPVSRRLMELEKERSERRKVRKRTKVIGGPSSSTDANKDIEMADISSTPASTSEPAPESQSNEQKGTIPGDLEDEAVYRQRELAELEGLVDPELKQDVGSSVSGLYELVAIVTHKGAAADAGHYIGFVKKSVFHSMHGKPPVLTEEPEASGSSSPPKKSPEFDESDEDWYKFDDEKVSIFPKEKLASLDGGGEDSSAYVLLYRSKPLA